MIWVAKDFTSFITRLQDTGHAHKHTCSAHFCSLASRLSHSRTEEHKKKLWEVGLWERQEEASRGWLVRKTGRSFEKLACEKDRKKLREVGLWGRSFEKLACEEDKKLQEVGLWGRQKASRGWLVKKTGRSFERSACEEHKKKLEWCPSLPSKAL